MKKTYIAITILAILIILTAWNLNYLENFLITRQQEVTASMEAETASEAIALLEQSLSAWNAASSYTHIFLRHSDIDNTTDAYYDLLQQLEDTETNPRPGYDYLLDQLWRIWEMERISIGSIL